ncbi:MAG TPA: hypothetical protein VGU22_12320 [Methylomirabilota bacterium]|jgi:hypothetical protein|nr:hypothetical protein [Methylomirabilota bacterium]
MTVEALLSVPPLVLGVALAVAGLGLVIVWRRYQRCPHCGLLASRVQQGWKRCGHCGRQYRKGLRVR